MNPVIDQSVMYYTYVLRSKKDSSWYTGATDNLRKRLTLHNTGKSNFTKKHIPYELIYYESCKNKEDAFAREKYLKSGPGKKFIRNRLKRFLSITG